MIYLILFVSIAFNVGFLVMSTVASCRKPDTFMPTPPAQRHQRMNKAFHDEDIKTARIENMELRKELFRELAKPEMDRQTIDQIVSNLIESQRTLEQNVLLHFVKVREESTPEEAQEIFGEYHKRYERNRERQTNQRDKTKTRKGETR